jgi:carbohydrate-binding DOMON domain-containing protein
MSKKFWTTGATAATVAAGLLLVAGAAFAQSGVSFKDPVGDDNGPGTYTYPTDGVYKRGSFDMTGFDVKVSGKKVEFNVSFNAALEDPWRMGGGFSVQMVFIAINTGKGAFKDSPAGTNVTFADDNGWDRMIILSPQSPGKVRSEIEAKVPAAEKGSYLVPTRVKGGGHTISGTVDLEELGGGDPSTWGYQVLIQSNEGYPDKTDLLTRKVNEYEGQHRFGGGTDSDCDPHVMDILAGNGAGTPDEADLQHQWLKYECNGDTRKSGGTIKMVYKKK